MTDQDGVASTAENTTIYPARRVITMNPARPFADAVAVRGDRVLGVGTVDELLAWGEATVDDRFQEHVLTPGFIEAHSHVMAGGMWTMPYLGYFDRRGADGKLWTGCKSIDAVLDRLAEVEAAMDDANEPLLAWGLDPIYFDGDRMLAKHLDRVSETRPMTAPALWRASRNRPPRTTRARSGASSAGGTEGGVGGVVMNV